MTLIRVDPTHLRETSDRLTSLAERLNQLARDALENAEAAPSYDGQFGPRVRALGAEAFAHLSARADRLDELASELAQIAEVFRQADLQTAASMAGLSGRLQEWLRGSARHLASWLETPFSWLGIHHLLGPDGLLDDGDDPDEPPWWAPLVIGAANLWQRFDGAIGEPLREALTSAPEVWEENRRMAATIALYYMAQGWYWYDESVNGLVYEIFDSLPMQQPPGMPPDGPLTPAFAALTAVDSSGNPVSIVGTELVQLIDARGGVTVMFSDALTSGGDAGVAPIKGLIWLPEAYRDPAVQSEPGNAALIAHELAHCLQRDLPEYPAGLPAVAAGSWPYSPAGFDPFNFEYGFPLGGDFTLYMEVQANLVGKTVNYDLLSAELASLPPGHGSIRVLQGQMGDLADDLATFAGPAHEAAAYVVEHYPKTGMYQGEMVREILTGARIPQGGWEHWLGEQGFSDIAIEHIGRVAGSGTPQPVHLSGMLQDPAASASPTPTATPSPTSTTTPTGTPSPPVTPRHLPE